MKCPLCKESRFTKLDTINAHELSLLYSKFFNADVSYLIKGNIEYCKCQNCKMGFFSPMITGDEKFYNFLQPFDWYYVDEKEEFLLAKKYIDRGAKVLEVGSGSGTFASHFSGDYTGLDFSPKAKEMAAKKGIKIENADIHEYVVSHTNEYDVVVCFQVLEHVSDPESFLTSMIKAIKIGGKLILAVPSEDSFIKHATNDVLNLPPHHVTRWSHEVFEFIEKSRGLKLINIEHESLQKAHKKFFLNTFFQSFFIHPKLVDTSLRRKIVAKVCDIFANFFLNRIHPEFVPSGHTVLAVFEKV